MPKNEDQEAAKILRQLEVRIVWLAALLVRLPGHLTNAAAERADEVLTEYEKRFPPIRP